jgi:uncharacterized membrane protein YgdD (TMEM256/DUF423 family)
MTDARQLHFVRWFLVFAAIVGASGVALAAVGAHAFAEILVGRSEIRFASALRMHLLHAPALIALAAAAAHAHPKWWLAALSLMGIGTLVFCGGLYLAALGISEAVLPVVPAGGSVLILSWVLAAVAFALGHPERPALR